MKLPVVTGYIVVDEHNAAKSVNLYPKEDVNEKDKNGRRNIPRGFRKPRGRR